MQTFIIEAAKQHRLPPSLCFVSENNSALLDFTIEILRYNFCDEDALSPDCNCPQCRLINSRSHPDIIVVEPEGKADMISVDTIRRTRKEAYQAPFQAREKTVIINRAHRMNLASANALLKVLEEPPELTSFILLTSNNHLMLPTLRSRCFTYPVHFGPEKIDIDQDLLSIAETLTSDLDIMSLAGILSDYSLPEAGALLHILGRETRDVRLIEAAYEVMKILADTSATFNKRLVLESILLSCFNEFLT